MVEAACQWVLHQVHCRGYQCNASRAPMCFVFAEAGAGRAELLRLLPRADIVVLACTEAVSTRGLVGREFLNACSDGVRIINVARGGLLDYDAVSEGLATDKISGLGLDVAWQVGCKCGVYMLPWLQSEHSASSTPFGRCPDTWHHLVILCIMPSSCRVIGSRHVANTSARTTLWTQLAKPWVSRSDRVVSRLTDSHECSRGAFMSTVIIDRCHHLGGQIFPCTSRSTAHRALHLSGISCCAPPLGVISTEPVHHAARRVLSSMCCQWSAGAPGS